MFLSESVLSHLFSIFAEPNLHHLCSMPFEICIFLTLEYSSNKYHLLEHLRMQKGYKNNQITWDENQIPKGI